MLCDVTVVKMTRMDSVCIHNKLTVFLNKLLQPNMLTYEV